MNLEHDMIRMKEAYGLLYTVENSLQRMEHYYGIHWFEVAPRREHNRPMKKPFMSHNFSYYTPYIFHYPKAFQTMSPEFCTKLRELYPIRNIIAHNHLLIDEKFETLQVISKYVIDFLTEELVVS